MFTGLVEEIGTITGVGLNNITIECKFIKELKCGDSICVNGACLTVTGINSNSFSADISDETLKVTNLKTLHIGDWVNLERAMSATARFDGHIVTGHVDTTAEIKNITVSNNFVTLKIPIHSDNLSNVVKKGSITVNGISLTIANIENNTAEIAIIPHTLNYTNLKNLKKGDIVNIEFDIISKYIEKKLAIYHNKSRISMEFLEENGFLS